MNLYRLSNGDLQTGDYPFRIKRDCTNVVYIVTEQCNFQCKYCLGWNKASKDDTLVDRLGADKVAADFRFLQESSRQQLYITLTGGEPSLITDFIPFVQKLAEFAFIELQTNLCTKSIQDFANSIDPKRIGQVMASYHNETVEKSDVLTLRYFENFHLLADRGFTVVFKIIALPWQLSSLADRLKEYKNKLPKDAPILVQPYIYEKYPNAYSKEEKALIEPLLRTRKSEILDYIDGAGEFEGMGCDAGAGFIVMDRQGYAYPCYSQFPHKKLGNLINRNIKLFDGPQLCPMPFCGTPFWALWYGMNSWEYVNRSSEKCEYSRFAPISNIPKIKVFSESYLSKRNLNGRISIVIPLRFNSNNSRIDQFKFCLESIANQTVTSLIEIVIGDYGSKSKYLTLIEELCQKFDAKFFHQGTNEIWNRARALNIGIRNSDPNSRYIFACDIDLILRNNCIEKILENVEENKLIISEIRDLPETGFPDLFDVQEDFFKLDALRSSPRPLGLGNCCFPRDWIFKIRGYDEEFKGWGGEDDDLIKRAKLDNLKIIRLHDLVYHQWHKSLFDDKEIIPFREANRKRLKELNTLIRNEGKEWGQIQE